jgi:hypothetical protein
MLTDKGYDMVNEDEDYKYLHTWENKFYAVDGIGSVDEIFDRLCGEIEKL